MMMMMKNGMKNISLVKTMLLVCFHCCVQKRQTQVFMHLCRN